MGRDAHLSRLQPGYLADVILIKNYDSRVSFPLLNPYGRVAFQAERGDVHTVIVNGRVVKRDHRLLGIDLGHARASIDETVDHLRSTLGEQAWQAGMHPEVPETRVLDNPIHLNGLRLRRHPRPLTAERGRLPLRPFPLSGTGAWTTSPAALSSPFAKGAGRS